MIQEQKIVDHESRVAHGNSYEYHVDRLCAHLARTQHAYVQDVCDHAECADHHTHATVVRTVDTGMGFCDIRSSDRPEVYIFVSFS